MPLYEYICETDGEKLELLRPASEADAPVNDPRGKGRTFKRVHSTFAAKGSPLAARASSGACCPCGKTAGSCRQPL